MTKLTKIEVYVADLPGCDDPVEHVTTSLEQSFGGVVGVFASDPVDIGEWRDDNILNFRDCPQHEYDKFFVTRSEKSA